jgi:hypothetical protein
MDVELAAADWLVLLVYFAGVVAIGRALGEGCLQLLSGNRRFGK